MGSSQHITSPHLLCVCLDLQWERQEGKKNNTCKCVGFFKDFIYLFLERGEGREKERERNISVWLPLMYPPLGTWPPTQECALIGN